MRVKAYLNKKNIQWFPINVEVRWCPEAQKDKKFVEYTGYYSPKQTDFEKLSEEEINERKKIVDEFEYIAIDTRHIQQIDVDTNQHDDGFVGALKEKNFPYFESMTKTYPHFLVKFNEEIDGNRVQTTYEGIEVLCGQWSFCNKDATIFNPEQEIISISNDIIKKKEIKEDNFYPDITLKYSNTTMKDILDKLSSKYYEEYDYWLRIGAVLFNEGYPKSLFDEFSQKSTTKYDRSGVDKLWNDYEKNPLTRVKLGTVMFYLKQSNPQYFNSIIKSIKTETQCSQVDILLQSGNISNTIVAKIFYESFKNKYSYSKKYWYRLNDGGIYEKLTMDCDVIISKEIRNYIQSFLIDVINSIQDEDKRKKLWKANATLEGNFFKMGCIAEAKTEFIDENLATELDKNIYLLGFTNGVFDLKTFTFRKGTIEDKVSMTTQYDFCECTNNKLDVFENLIDGYFKTKETSHYFKKHLGSLLEGINSEEHV